MQKGKKKSAMIMMATINELARRPNMAGEVLGSKVCVSVTPRFRLAVNSSAGSLCNESFPIEECPCRQVPDCNRVFSDFWNMHLCGTGHALGSTCEGGKKRNES